VCAQINKYYGSATYFEGILHVYFTLGGKSGGRHSVYALMCICLV
jgi:hypothetical protein